MGCQLCWGKEPQVLPPLCGDFDILSLVSKYHNSYAFSLHEFLLLFIDPICLLDEVIKTLEIDKGPLAGVDGHDKVLILAYITEDL